MGIIQGMGAHKPVARFPSVLSGPLRSSVVLDMILSMEKAKGFGEDSTALLGSSLGQDMTVSRGKELAIASFFPAELGMSSVLRRCLLLEARESGTLHQF